MIHIRKIDHSGHTQTDVTVPDAYEMIEANKGRYFVVNEDTMQVMREIKLKDGQNLMLVPIITGG